ncbi:MULTISPECIES: LysR substrate-binding domain-containing protein [Marinobacter]|jgi:LysR family transcriptional regulator, nitrogen assimilation regulatory protein|uniref:LysR family transcriptional regulator n=1 Tax=Marinobacter TaxID=2742 RepID=UPI001BCF5BC1|nr:LysR substrate-binding domain-containing protein [Marinobacter salarius]MBS8232586.1 LysR family transcriptional regulator [Marinobacter salarius]WOI17947.1 LysR substrate-binding domain-containing protein [Marinobacter salarius]
MPFNLNIDLRQLNTFLTVADTGSFSRASEKLFVAQPALSRQIRMLEEALNVEVFVRHGRGVVLTAAGELLYERARILLQSLERTQADVTAVAGEVTGQVILGLLPTVTHRFSGTIIEQYRKRFPQVHLAVKSAMSGTLQQMVMQHRLNLAISYNHSNHKNLRYRPLIEEQLYLISPTDTRISKRSEITLDEVVELPLVIPEEKHGLRISMEKEAAERNKTLNLAMEVSAWPMLTDMVRRGLGYTILSSAAVHDMVQRNEVVAIPITSPEIKRTLSIVTPTDLPASVATMKLAEIIMQQVAEQVEAGKWKGKLLFNPKKISQAARKDGEITGINE